MTLQAIKNLLLTVTDNVYHYHAWEQPDKYIVWAEDSEGNSLHADNQKQVQVIQGTIDYFTKDEGDINVELIQKAMNDNEISCRLNSIQYEEGTDYIHYEWVFEVEGL